MGSNLYTALLQFNNSDDGLFKLLYKSAEQVLAVVNILPDLQYAIGLDILPDDLSLGDTMLKEQFSGTFNSWS